MQNEYERILGVSHNSSKAEIKLAFRKAAKKFHPDNNSSPYAQDTFLQIKNAYDILINQLDQSILSESNNLTSEKKPFFTTNHTESKDFNNYQEIGQTKKVQDLDELVYNTKKKSILNFRRRKESDELKRHRKKLKVNERRLKGLY